MLAQPGAQRRLTPAERAALWCDDSPWAQVGHVISDRRDVIYGCVLGGGGFELSVDTDVILRRLEPRHPHYEAAVTGTDRGNAPQRTPVRSAKA